ncbi:calcium and integrin-binding protein 1-like isoform X1 [Stegostoma tigrinum]|uniref:calcium and integrin-binding protein 1-like isoform X1 n=1 Tax=Stegostoma tigrinum TaxID=3053191 RepID=UPI00202AF71A|nr:calcium and integrin-binding protein 1-like isoform X1 [Stegostoma tigrinum]XP_048376393.1 calcium and integrin-binding protein 1-like isoform X1 [Stegostoma tigrinum]XP_048376394.1 calcium and integrin-binding protein 1-like isoform X1 [Stegostoma tigrinum]
MGGSASHLSKEQLSEYQELTFLTKQDILHAYRIFAELLSKDLVDFQNTRVSKDRICEMPELKANPFRERICLVFSTAIEKDGSMSFEDFLDMLSAFSDSATPEIKSHYAFRIFDFDDDGTLDKEDLKKLVNCLTGGTSDTQLTEAEMNQLIQNELCGSEMQDVAKHSLLQEYQLEFQKLTILEESDIDKDGTVNLSEFQHVISRSPDFVSSFKIVL